MMNRASSSIAGVNSVVNFNALMTVSTNRCLWIEWMRFLNIVFAVAKTSVWRLILRLVSSSICTGLTMHKLHKFYWMNQCQLQKCFCLFTNFHLHLRIRWWMYASFCLFCEVRILFSWFCRFLDGESLLLSVKVVREECCWLRWWPLHVC